MSINATLFVQMISFLLFALFTKKFVWPPLVNAMNERQDKIANGIAEGERGRYELAEAQKKSLEIVKEAREQASTIVEQANRQASTIVDDAKKSAREQADKIREQADHDVSTAYEKAKSDLMKEMAGIVYQGAKAIIGQNINEAANNDLIEQAIGKVEGAS